MIEAAGFHDVVAEDRTNQVFFFSLNSFSLTRSLSWIMVLMGYVIFTVFGSIAEGTGYDCEEQR